MARTRQTAADRELEAMGSILRAFEGLDGESIQRVLDYVFSRLSIAPSARGKIAVAVATPPALPTAETHRTRRPSIRDLKDEKQPESANQMAALVAYYLSEEADADHKDVVTTADLEKYFKQAGFKLPKSLPQTLANAAAAGYFDAIGNGQYRLNAVGYNLVVHALPRPQSTNRPTTKRSKKKTAKAPTRKKRL